MRSHKLPKNILNSEAEFFISEYVRYSNHRSMLRDWWFTPMTLQQIAEKYNYSLTRTKEILYNYTDQLPQTLAGKIQNE